MTDHEPQPEQLRAAEYVLGTLSEAERADVDADLLRRDPETVRAVGEWEQRLGRLGLALEPVDPPPGTWSRIALATGVGRRAGDDGARGGATGVWRGLALVASVAALALATVLAFGVLRAPETQAPAYASVIRDEPTGAGWLLTASAQTSALEVTALSPYPTPKNKSLHLWLVPAEGGPISLGLLPQKGHAEMPMPERATAKLSGNKARFAVSLEPPGGSPKPVPTGKILWAVPVTGASG